MLIFPGSKPTDAYSEVPSWAAVENRVRQSPYYRRVCQPLRDVPTWAAAARAEVTYVGGAQSDPPAPFLCLLVRLRALRPGEQALQACLQDDQSVYVRVLAAAAVRAAARHGPRVYQLLDPLLADYRMIRVRDVHSDAMHEWPVDEWIDRLLRFHGPSTIACDDRLLPGVPFPYLAPRWELECRGQLQVRPYAESWERERVTQIPR